MVRRDQVETPAQRCGNSDGDESRRLLVDAAQRMSPSRRNISKTSRRRRSSGAAPPTSRSRASPSVSRRARSCCSSAEPTSATWRVRALLAVGRRADLSLAGRSGGGGAGDARRAADVARHLHCS
jgi:hypothetical protein